MFLKTRSFTSQVVQHMVRRLNWIYGCPEFRNAKEASHYLREALDHARFWTKRGEWGKACKDWEETTGMASWVMEELL